MDEERKGRLVGFLNAAVNLYGVVSFEELVALHGRYAPWERGAATGPLRTEEIDELLALPQPDDTDLDEEERWFAEAVVDGRRYLVARYGFSVEREDGTDEIDADAVRDTIADFAVDELKMLPLADFAVYDEPKAFEETGVTKRFAKFLRREYGFGREEAEFAVWDVQGELRYAPSMRVALISARNTLQLEVTDREDFDELVAELTPLVRNTRCWDYRGHTETELVGAGVLKAFCPLDGEDVFDWFMDDAEGEKDGAARGDGETDAPEASASADRAIEEILPPAEYPTEPVDFAFVKDRERRELAVTEYNCVRTLTSEFVREVLAKKLTQKARKAAMKRLGFPTPKQYGMLEMNLDIVAGYFASMLDDQFGEPLLRKVLRAEAKLTERQRLGARYFRNARLAWLVVEAAKSGVGMKCLNLMTGEELFLMEKSLSATPDIRGMTLCGTIAPMGRVYLSLGVLQPADFEPSAAVHRLIRRNLGLPLDGPLDLSPADEARFAEDAIRRIHALGRLGGIVYGGR